MAGNTLATPPSAAGTHTKAATPSAPEQVGLNGRPIFCFHFADVQSKNDWKFKPDRGDAKTILKKLAEFAQMSWRELLAVDDGNKHHFHPISDIERKARNDLARTEIDRLLVDERLFRFSITSKGRLWGWKHKDTFHVVWWDPHHKVYPVPAREERGDLRGRRRRDGRQNRAASSR